jgi:hypothetical protein
MNRKYSSSMCMQNLTLHKKNQGEIKKSIRLVNCYGWDWSCVIRNPPKFTSFFSLHIFFLQEHFINLHYQQL